jgi:hypothetical protein
MLFLLEFLILIGTLNIILLIRTQLIYKIRYRAINSIHLKNLKSENYDLNCYDRLDKPSFNYMMFDISKWTFKQFYPDLEEFEE